MIFTQDDFIPYDPSASTPAGKVANDAPNHRIVFSPNDVPGNVAQIVRITTTTVYIRASAVDTATRDQLADAFRNDGLFTKKLSDESVIDQYGANLRAAAGLVEFCQVLYTVVFEVRSTSDIWRKGQQLRVIDTGYSPNLSVVLTIQSAPARWVGAVGGLDEFVFSCTASNRPLDLKQLLARSVRLSYFPQRARLTQITG